MNSNVPIGYIASNGVWLEPSDSMGRAVELLESSDSGAVPVMDGGVLCGLVSDREIARGLCGGENTRVRDVMTRAVPLAPPDMPAEQGLALLAETDFPALPVATAEGRFIGTVGRTELLKLLFHRRRPKQIGGMATPLGVYLSDGTTRGGVGDLALMLTGVFLFVGSLAAFLVSVWAQGLWARYGFPDVVRPDVFGSGAYLVAFALWFRLSWVAGYHAAEHQTVHAIERNEPLTVENVALMPRPHPRCGTNLVVLFSIFTTLVGMMHVDALLAGIFSLVAYRFFGHWVQLHITTRVATRRQLESGIRAGRQLLERYQNGAPAPRFGVLGRVWNMGILQVALPSAVLLEVLSFLASRGYFVGWLSRYLQ